jgi:hypothetical protein
MITSNIVLFCGCLRPHQLPALDPAQQLLLLSRLHLCCCCLAAAVSWNHLLFIEGLLDGSMRENHEDAAVSAWWNPKHDLESSFEMLKSSWLNVLLVAAPLGIVAHALQWQATTVFLLVRLLRLWLCSTQHMQYMQLLYSCRTSAHCRNSSTAVLGSAVQVMLQHVGFWPFTASDKAVESINTDLQSSRCFSLMYRTLAVLYVTPAEQPHRPRCFQLCMVQQTACMQASEFWLQLCC